MCSWQELRPPESPHAKECCVEFLNKNNLVSNNNTFESLKSKIEGRPSHQVSKKAKGKKKLIEQEVADDIGNSGKARDLWYEELGRQQEIFYVRATMYTNLKDDIEVQMREIEIGRWV